MQEEDVRCRRGGSEVWKRRSEGWKRMVEE